MPVPVPLTWVAWAVWASNLRIRPRTWGNPSMAQKWARTVWFGPTFHFRKHTSTREHAQRRFLCLDILLRRCIECLANRLQRFFNLRLSATPLRGEFLERGGRGTAPRSLQLVEVAHHGLHLVRDRISADRNAIGGALHLAGIHFKFHFNSSVRHRYLTCLTLYERTEPRQRRPTIC